MEERKFLSFKQAREFVRKLGLKTREEYQDYCESGKKPDDVSSSMKSKKG